MDGRVMRVNREVRQYDSRLFAVRTSLGAILIYRKAERIEASDFGYDSELARFQPQFILALTDNWKREGRPVEWGLEPLMARIRAMDSWNDLDDGYHAMVKRRDGEKAEKDRAFRNNARAAAADMRKDFAKATNDINTSNL